VVRKGDVWNDEKEEMSSSHCKLVTNRCQTHTDTDTDTDAADWLTHCQAKIENAVQPGPLIHINPSSYRNGPIQHVNVVLISYPKSGVSWMTFSIQVLHHQLVAGYSV